MNLSVRWNEATGIRSCSMLRSSDAKVKGYFKVVKHDVLTVSVFGFTESVSMVNPQCFCRKKDASN
jgi:hypothetical protein